MPSTTVIESLAYGASYNSKHYFVDITHTTCLDIVFYTHVLIKPSFVLGVLDEMMWYIN